MRDHDHSLPVEEGGYCPACSTDDLCPANHNGSRCQKAANHGGVHYAQVSAHSAIAWGAPLYPNDQVEERPRNGN